jgi:hypothetical protein
LRNFLVIHLQRCQVFSCLRELPWECPFQAPFR